MDLLDILYAIAKLWESFFCAALCCVARDIYICTICFQFFLFFYNISLVSLDDKHLCIFWNIYEREREKEREKLVSFEHKTYTWLCERGCVCVCECLCVCVYVVGPRRKWTQGMVKRLTHKSYTNKSVSRILCISLCLSVCVCYASVIWSEMFRQGLCTCKHINRHAHIYIHTAYGAYVLWTCARLIV